MKIKDVMTQSPQVINVDSTLKEAACVMRDNDFGVVPVYRENKLVGMVTDRDLVVRALAEGKTGDDPLSSVVTDDILYCFENQDVLDVLDVLNNMQNTHVQRLIVLDNENEKDLVGIVSLADIADACNDSESIQAIANCCRHY